MQGYDQQPGLSQLGISSSITMGGVHFLVKKSLEAWCHAGFESQKSSHSVAVIEAPQLDASPGVNQDITH